MNNFEENPVNVYLFETLNWRLNKSQESIIYTEDSYNFYWNR